MVGFVGTGMLSAAVVGEVFASPSEDAVFAAIKKVAGPKGVLVVVMNYTGDRLNFGAAVERAKAEGIKAAMVIVADDAALDHVVEGAAGRRGIAGTVLVHKVAGAAAAAGFSLEDVRRAAQTAADHLASVGCSLTACARPGAPDPTRIGPEEMEVGLGIHGEPGARRCEVLSANEVAKETVDTALARFERRKEPAAAPGPAAAEAVALINDLGALTGLELGVLTRAVVRRLRERGTKVRRVYAGRVMGALDMRGASTTVLALPPGDEGERLLALLDAPTAAPAWPADGEAWRRLDEELDELSGGEDEELDESAQTGAEASERPIDAVGVAARVAPVPDGVATAVPGSDPDGEIVPNAHRAVTPAGQAFEAAVRAAAEAALEQKKVLDELDFKLGDGDCGSTLADGANAALRALDGPGLGADDFPAGLKALGAVVGRAMGGTSGAVYKILLTAAAASLVGGNPPDADDDDDTDSDSDGDDDGRVASDGPSYGELPTVAQAARALAAGLRAVSTYGGAVEGDRTAVDALAPASRALTEAAKNGLEGPAAAVQVAKAAADGAENTATMGRAKAGRASYVNAEEYEGVRDPGAVGVAAWIGAIAREMSE